MGEYGMLRGINKQVVEVVDTENEYFEKAILFVKAEKQERDEKTIKQRASEYVKGISYTPRKRLSPGQWAMAVIKFASAAAVGAAAMAMLVR